MKSLSRRDLVRLRSSSESTEFQVFASFSVPVFELLTSVLILESLGGCCWIGDTGSSSPSSLKENKDKEGDEKEEKAETRERSAISLTRRKSERRLRRRKEKRRTSCRVRRA